MNKPFPGYPKGYEFDEPSLDRDGNPTEFEDKYPHEMIEAARRILKAQQSSGMRYCYYSSFLKKMVFVKEIDSDLKELGDDEIFDLEEDFHHALEALTENIRNYDTKY